MNLNGQTENREASKMIGTGFAHSDEDGQYQSLSIDGSMNVQYDLSMIVTASTVLEFSFSFEGELALKAGVCVNIDEACFWVSGHEVEDADLVPGRYGKRAQKEGTKYNIKLSDKRFGSITGLSSITLVQKCAKTECSAKSFFTNVALYDPKPAAVYESNDAMLVTLPLNYNAVIKKVKAEVIVQNSPSEYAHAELDSGDAFTATPGLGISLHKFEPGKRYRSILVPASSDGTSLGLEYVHHTIVESTIMPCSCDVSQKLSPFYCV